MFWGFFCHFFRHSGPAPLRSEMFPRTQGCGFTASPAGALCNYFSLLRHLHYRLLYNSTLLRAVQFDHALACDIINICKLVSHGRCSRIHHHYHHRYHPCCYNTHPLVVRTWAGSGSTCGSLCHNRRRRAAGPENGGDVQRIIYIWRDVTVPLSVQHAVRRMCVCVCVPRDESKV